MARQCTQPKRPRNAAWFKEKEMLAEAQESRQILDEEQLAFLADPGILDTHVKKKIDSQMDDMIKEKLALRQQIDSLEQDLSNQIKEKESLLETFTVFKNQSKGK
ncbi:hypothetical protein Tco_1551852 [Tanacetum coccineum]